MRKIAFALIILAAVVLLKITERKQSTPLAKAQTTDSVATTSAAPVAELPKVETPAATPVAAPKTASSPIKQKVAKAKQVAKPKQIEQHVSSAQSAPLSASNTLSMDVLTDKLDLGRGEFAGAIATGYSSNLYEGGAYEREASATYQLHLDYKINNGPNTLRALFAGYKELTKGEENKLRDGYVAWLNNELYYKGKMASVGQHVRLIVPMSDDSVKRDERLTGVMVAPLLVLDLTPVGLTGVSLVYQPRLTRNFHKYETNRINNTNNEYSFGHLGSLKWAMTDRWYVASDLLYSSAWSYGGVKKDDSYEATTEIGYTFSNGLNLAGGLTNDGKVTSVEQGNDQNVKLFDKETASVYTELTYSF